MSPSCPTIQPSPACFSVGLALFAWLLSLQFVVASKPDFMAMSVGVVHGDRVATCISPPLFCAKLQCLGISLDNTATVSLWQWFLD